MNDMTDAQISKALALAIGWQESDFYQGGDGSYVAVRYPGVFGTTWKVFDYSSPEVVWRVAERFDCFPYRIGDNGWGSQVLSEADGCFFQEASTPEKAAALAVIAAHGG